MTPLRGTLAPSFRSCVPCPARASLTISGVPSCLDHGWRVVGEVTGTEPSERSEEASPEETR